MTERSSEELRHEIGVTREELGSLLVQLDRRRRELFDWRLLVRRHPVAVALAGAFLVLSLAGTTSLLLRRNR